MAFEVPHKHDISLDGQEMRNQMIENFEAIEHEDQQDDALLNQEIHDRKDADRRLRDQIDKMIERVGTLESQVQQLQENDKDHEKRLKRIEELLFGSQPINASTVMVDDDSEHQGYDVADAPDYDYQEQEIN